MKKIMIGLGVVAVFGAGLWIGQSKNVPFINGDLVLYVEKEAETEGEVKVEAQEADKRYVEERRFRLEDYQPSDNDDKTDIAENKSPRDAIEPVSTVQPESDTSSRESNVRDSYITAVRLNQFNRKHLNLGADANHEKESCRGNNITLWHGYRGIEKAAVEKVVDSYNKTRRRCGEVKALGVPFDAYADKITLAMPRGKGGDVFIYAQDRLGGWVEDGETVEPIERFVDDETLDQFIPSTVDAMIYKNSLYGLPLNFKVTALIYNKAMIKTPPKTSDELVSIAKQHTNKPSGKYGLAYEYANYYFHSALQNAFGGRVFEEAAMPVINSPQNLSAMDYLLKWYRVDGILPAEPTGDVVQSMFNSGKSPMVISGPWFLSEISPDIEYGISTLPIIREAGNQRMRPWLTVEGVYLAKHSPNKGDGYELIRYLTSPEAGIVMATQAKQNPANDRVYDDQAVNTSQVLMAFRQQAEASEPLPNLPEMMVVWSPITTAMNQIVKGSHQPVEALEVAQNKVVKAIRGW